MEIIEERALFSSDQLQDDVGTQDVPPWARLGQPPAAR